MNGDDTRKEERRNRRRTVVMTGKIIVNGQPIACRIRNLSATGLMVACDIPLAPGTVVHAEISRYGSFPAVVSWTEGGRMGLTFVDGAAGGLARFGDRAAVLGLIEDEDGLPDIAAGDDGHG